MGSCISALTTMGRFLPFLCLLGLALSGPVVDQETDKMVREMGDVIEAGLIEPSHGDARALFISLTLTSTSTSLATATVTSGHSHEKRPRIIALQNEIITKNLTSTSTVLVTDATSTLTFTIEAACTPSSFTGFAFSSCTATTG